MLTLEFRSEPFQLLIFDDSVQEIIQIQPLELLTELHHVISHHLLE